VPKWVSILLIVAGFFAIVGLAFVPRVLEINIEINDSSTHGVVGTPHAEPAPPADEDSL
jgi:hypothetical protein